MQLLNHSQNGNRDDHHDAMPTWLVIDSLICCELCQLKGDLQMMDGLQMTLRQQANRLQNDVGAWSNDQLKWMGT
jgi:hypothetical protein